MFIRDKDDEKETQNEEDTTSDDEKDDAEDSDTDSEDGEESSDDDKEEEDEDNAEDNDEEDILKKYNADPASVPKELRAPLKKLLGNHTRAMQAIAGEKKKINAFNALNKMPEFHKFIEAMQTGGRYVLNDNSKKSRRSEDDDSDSEDNDDNERPLTKQELAKLLDDRDKQNATREQQAREREKQAREWAKELEQFKEDYPDWKLYKTEIAEELDKANDMITYEEAYLRVTRDIDKEERNERRLAAKKRASALNPKNKAQGKDVKKQKEASSIREAFEMAERDLGES